MNTGEKIDYMIQCLQVANEVKEDGTVECKYSTEM